MTHPSIPKKTAVVCVNLGTPSQATFLGVRRFLKDFLSDQRVVDTPKFIWWWILNLIILTVRPGRVAKQYQKVWHEEGSPLMVHSKRLVNALQDQLGEHFDVKLAMRYGDPQLKEVLTDISKNHYQKLIILPLFPQYSATTTASIFDEVSRFYQKQSYIPSLNFINHYADYPLYIEALAQSLEDHWKNHDKGERLVISYHGIPDRYFKRGDPYYCFCSKTTRLLRERLHDDSIIMVFQSRFGPGKWLEPSCETTIEELAKEGIKRLDIISPGFAADCLETIEEIDETYREVFMEHGGEQYHYIAALNDQAHHVTALKSLIESHAL